MPRTPAAHELGNRIRAARGYAGDMTQKELADRIGFSLSTIQRIENGSRGMRPYEERAFVDVVAEETGLPPAFFTADFEQLDPGYVPPEEELARTNSLLGDVLEALAHSVTAGEQHTREAAARAKALEKRLGEIERRLGELSRRQKRAA